MPVGVGTERHFLLIDDKNEQIFFCDNSDNEKALNLDEEDVSFLEHDVQEAERSTGTSINPPVEVIIEPASKATDPVPEKDQQSLYTNANTIGEQRHDIDTNQTVARTFVTPYFNEANGTTGRFLFYLWDNF